VFDASKGTRVLVLEEDAPAVFTPEGHLLISTSTREGLQEVEIPSGKVVGKIGTGWPRNGASARDRIYGAGQDQARQRIISIWERGGAHRKLGEIALPSPVWALEVTPRGEAIAMLRDKILIHDAQGKLRRTFDGPHSTIALTPDGKRLLASTGDGV